ncbi:adenylyltransferase/cytidyltransferase family protein [Pseudomonas viridiflava]|uniref:adenylyltransferase/cytidyltransferase family protein n=1 Tax=Pseudomonas viridiflava TaxID=33069 RepID=UPI0018E5C4F9|nr:adenylyltransferase/cytidyltransferase family protein [Pseudomonas viridiflava]MBI6727551.1 adenylyltransferase/cytidyltransferase family protein [Pseudomonas viridiflava]
MKKFALAVYGGAFNPPHPGHATVVASLLDKAEKVVVVPSYAHPFGKKMMPFEQRVRWAKAMIANFDPNIVSVETCEMDAALIKSPVFSIDLLRFIADRDKIEGKEIALVMGEDVGDIFKTFYGYDDIISEFSTLVVSETIHLHSSMIREKLLEEGDIPSEWKLSGVPMEDYLQFATLKQSA